MPLLYVYVYVFTSCKVFSGSCIGVLRFGRVYGGEKMAPGGGERVYDGLREPSVCVRTRKCTVVRGGVVYTVGRYI